MTLRVNHDVHPVSSITKMSEFILHKILRSSIFREILDIFECHFVPLWRLSEFHAVTIHAFPRRLRLTSLQPLVRLRPTKFAYDVLYKRVDLSFVLEAKGRN